MSSGAIRPDRGVAGSEVLVPGRLLSGTLDLANFIAKTICHRGGSAAVRLGRILAIAVAVAGGTDRLDTHNDDLKKQLRDELQNRLE
jgi:hypothetical protein